MKKSIMTMLLVLGFAVGAGAREARPKPIPDEFYRKDGKVYLTTSSPEEAEKGVYVGIGPQYLQVKYDNRVNSYSFPKDLFGVRIFAGEKISDRFAIEGSYSFAYGERYENFAGVGTDVEVRVHTIDADIIFRQPVADSVSCYLLLGVYYAYAESDLETSVGVSGDDSDGGMGISMGVGAEVDVAEDVFIKGAYRYRYMDTRYMEVVEDIDDVHDLSFGVGVRW